MATPARRALYGKLAGDTTLNNLLATPPTGYSQVASTTSRPPPAQRSRSWFSKQAGRPTEALADPSAFENDMWLVKAVDRATTADPAEAISARVVDPVERRGPLDLRQHDACTCVASPTWTIPKSRTASRYQHVGSLYRLVFTD